MMFLFRRHVKSILTIIWILSVMRCANSGETNEKKSKTHPLLAKGKCKGLWRPDHLVGRCFGLSPSTGKRYRELLEGVDIKSSSDCRAVCCNLGEKCVSWQYLAATNECKLGGVVRLGFEKTGTPDWCDPQPPEVWNGKRLFSRGIDGQCIWSEKNQSTQCFGLGDQRRSPIGESLSTAECAKACCEDTSCDIWQETPNRGCYFGRTTQCPKSQGPWEGQRKCLPKYCGGQENEILPAYEALQKKLAMESNK